MFRVLLLCTLFGASCMSAELDVKIADYKGAKGGAISLTFDDGWRKEVKDALSIIDPLEIKGTFFFMPHAMEKSPKSHATWADAKNMQANGHEIGTHDKVKPRLHELDKKTLSKKVNSAYQLIIDKTGVVPVSFALPGGTKPTDIVKEVVYQKHAFIRKPNTFSDIAEVTAYGNAGRKKWDLQREQGKIEEVIANGKWRVPVIHAIAGGGYAPFPSKQAFKDYCEWLHAQRERIWIAPMGTVARYIKARKTAKIHITKLDKNSVTFSVAVPEELRELCAEALSIIVPIKKAGADISVSGGESYKATDDAVLVDVIPDGRDVSVSWK